MQASKTLQSMIILSMINTIFTILLVIVDLVVIFIIVQQMASLNLIPIIIWIIIIITANIVIIIIIIDLVIIIIRQLSSCQRQSDWAYSQFHVGATTSLSKPPLSWHHRHFVKAVSSSSLFYHNFFINIAPVVLCKCWWAWAFSEFLLFLEPPAATCWPGWLGWQVTKTWSLSASPK